MELNKREQLTPAVYACQMALDIMSDFMNACPTADFETCQQKSNQIETALNVIKKKMQSIQVCLDR